MQCEANKPVSEDLNGTRFSLSKRAKETFVKEIRYLQVNTQESIISISLVIQMLAS